MNILYICDQIGSAEMGMVFRPYYLAKEFNKLGHCTTIIGASFAHNRKINPNVMNDLDESIIDGIKYVWIKTCTYSSSLQRLKNIFLFVHKLKKHAKIIAERYRPDIIISACAHNLDIYAAIKIRRYSNSKLVYEVRDLWPLSPMELGGYSKYHPFIMVLQHAENTAYQKSDFVVSALPCVHEYMQEHGLDLNKLVIIPNGISEDVWRENADFFSIKRLLACVSNEKNNGKAIVGYVGSFGKMYSLESLIYAAAILKNSAISFIIIGSGEKKDIIESEIKKYKLKNVFIFDQVSKNNIPYILSCFDITFIGFMNISVFRFGISPNKIMEYMMAGKPIISAIKAGNDPVIEAQCGITVEPENPQAIADGILKLAALSPEERDTMGKRGRDYILKNQTYDILAKKFLDFVAR